MCGESSVTQHLCEEADGWLAGKTNNFSRRPLHHTVVYVEGRLINAATIFNFC